MKLNLGATNPSPLTPNWKTVDIGTADIQHDLSQFPWPFETESVDFLLASHVLEHFPREKGVSFLEECHRILKPGGRIRIAVPDMDRFIDGKLKNDESDLAGYRWNDLNHFMGGPAELEANPYMRHSYMYCFASLAWTLQEAGFREIFRYRYGEYHAPEFAGVDTEQFQHISLYVEAEKR